MKQINNFESYQKNKVQNNLKKISYTLDNELPSRWIPSNQTEFFDYIAQKTLISRSMLIRANSPYRKIILEKYFGIKHASGILEGAEKKSALLARDVELKRIEISNLTTKVTKLTNILKSIDPKTNTIPVSEPSKPRNYLKEYDEVCRCLKQVVDYLVDLGIAINQDGSVIDSGSADGSIVIVVDCAKMKSYLSWRDGRK
jgi:hypothetical protein